MRGTAEKLNQKNPEQQYERARTKLAGYVLLLIVLVLLPVIGYVVDTGFQLPGKETLPYLWLDIGTYAVLGISTIFIILLILSTICVLIISLINGGLLSAVIMTILFYGLAAGIFVQVIQWVYSTVRTDFTFSFMGIHISGSQVVPGISETLGMALVNSLFYGVPLIFCGIRAVILRKKCAALRGPALEAKALREIEESRKREEQERQKEARRIQKEKERRAREEWERHKQAMEAEKS